MDEPPPLFPRPMSLGAAICWTAATMMLLGFALTALGGLGGGQINTASGVGSQVAVYLVCLFGILRAHAPDASLRAFFGFRGTHPLYFPLGLFLGVTVCALTTAVGTVLLNLSPTGQEGEIGADILGSSPGQRGVAFVAICLAGPLVEEMFFRGALIAGLRKTHPLAATLVLSSALFAIVHLRWQLMVPMLLGGLAFGVVRIVSGSLFPSTLAHMTHNALSFVVLLRAGSQGDREKELIAPLGALGIFGTAILVALALVIGRTHAATRARAADGTA